MARVATLGVGRTGPPRAARSVPRLKAVAGASIVAVAIALLATPALASRWTVDLGGGGDFTTIQAALDQQAIAFRDTVLVMPGEYAETIQLAALPISTFLIGALGAGATRVNSIAFVDSGPRYPDSTTVENVRFTEAVSIQAGVTDGRRLRRCVFMKDVSASGVSPNLEDCDFHGPTQIRDYTTGGDGRRFAKLRFHSAPLTVIAGGFGPMHFVGCQFDGPGGVLVRARGTEDLPAFENCRFQNAATGILFDETDSSMGGPSIRACQFMDLWDCGVMLEPDTVWFNPNAPSEVYAGDSRFERCGTAVRNLSLRPLGNRGVALYRDTILASVGNAVEIGLNEGAVVDCIIDGSGGHGVEFRHLVQPGAPPIYRGIVSGSIFTNNAGDGARVTNTADELPVNWIGHYTVANCTFARNGGAGLRAEWPYWEVWGCISLANGGDGFALRTTLEGRPNRLASNTSALNQGDGFRLVGPAQPGDSLHVVRSNLAVLNAGAGFRVPAQPFGSFAFNDAWGNYQGQHVGAWASLDSNLTVDPRFCALGAGNLTLELGSPCGAGGVYGLIGALPEACPNTLGAGPGAPAGVAFAVRPSVARGSVEFLPPATGGEGVVELFDLAGRVLWRAPLGPATGAVRWRGEGREGHVRAGLYWARFTRGEESATRRLVWLE